MAAKKKQAKAKTKAKPKANAKLKAKAKAKAKPKLKAKTKAKPKAKAKAQPKAKAKAKPQKRKVATPTVEVRSEQIILDVSIEEPLTDVSTVIRLKDRLAQAQQRDVDEDAQRAFADPSLVVEAEATRDPKRAEDDTDESQLPGLFAAEERRQKQRAADGATPLGRDGSLFGLDDDED